MPVVGSQPLPRPSSAHRWVGGGCPGSVPLEAKYPETSSEAADNGTRLHGLAAAVLKGGARAYNAEDAQAIDPYIANVLAEVAARPNARLLVEQEVCWINLRHLRGTPDAALIDFANRHIIIWDLKTGWRIVEALGNWQLTCYALFHARPGWTFDLRIAQPLPFHRDGSVRSWAVTWEQLEARAPVVEAAFREAISDEPPLRPGGHCLYCSAIVGCEAARGVSLGAVDIASREIVDLPDAYLGRELQVLRDTLRVLDLRVSALEETVGSRLRAGARIPGVCMRESSGGRVKWAEDEEKVRFALKVLTGEDLAVPKLPTPTQLKNSGVSEDLLRPFTRYQPGKMVVATDADDQAKKVFGDAPNMEHTR